MQTRGQGCTPAFCRRQDAYKVPYKLFRSFTLTFKPFTNNPVHTRIGLDLELQMTFVLTGHALPTPKVVGNDFVHTLSPSQHDRFKLRQIQNLMDGTRPSSLHQQWDVRFTSEFLYGPPQHAAAYHRLAFITGAYLDGVYRRSMPSIRLAALWILAVV
jgi:hypothetical protein